MKISKDKVLKVATLAYLNLSDSSIEKFLNQLGDILEYVETLNKIDTENIPSTSYATFLNNSFREDERKQSIGMEEALSNAPEKEDGYFIVPKVVG